MIKARIGTSGWVYPHWQPDFYPADLPQKKWLEYYGQKFDTVEVNSSFYHQVLPKTYENWSQNVPKSFIFALKGSRFITHIKRLKDSKEPLKNFFESAKFLEGKLGPILFQLPPRMKADKERLESFLSTANRLRSTAVVGSRKSVVRLAFEFRDQSWFEKEIYKTLGKYNAGLVIADSGGNWPTEEVVTADFVYIRFHGKELYSSNYPKKELQGWAAKIKNWCKSSLDVYVYFNNDVLGYAVENAKTMLKLVT
jgi:uncharacterized protein YecE (DUF72 family)